MLGLGLITAGFSVLLWCISLHFKHYSTRVPMDSRPRFLLLHGPYKISRNPLYISDVTILLGWALFYGSLAVFLAGLAFAAFLAFVLVPSEERQLLDRFGNEYLTYKNSVPRWVGRPRL
jgi:protein-S-isoprenylcysteine O-methyltransferase Ste14